MRKFLLSIIFLPFFTILYSQNPNELSVDSLLTNIDMSDLNTGILYDRALPLSQLNYYNDSINVANTGYFEQALLELRKASQDQKFANYQDLRNLYSPEESTDVVDIGILNARYQQLNYNPVDESLGGLHLEDSLFVKNTNGEPSFLENHLFLVAPLKEYALGESITYHFDSALILEEAAGRELVTLNVDFDSNQTYDIIQNGNLVQNNITIPYSEEGYKILTFTAGFSDGFTRITQGVLHLKLPAPPPSDPLIDNGSIWSNLPWQGFNENAAYIGKLDYRIFYRTNNGNSQKTLMKPIVIIDGFDPGDKRKIQDSDSNLPNEVHRSIEDMMIYQNSMGQQDTLIGTLREIGYDVVIVNHPIHYANGFRIDGGADYIERNALTHVNLYQHLNGLLAQNGSNAELVIVGPSMGGSISRYALAYMEKNGIAHNTRLWISVDSPHLGANIPLGAQSLLHLVKDNSQAAQQFIDEYLESPAARQQLIEQYCGETNNILNQDWMDGRTVSQGFSQNRGRPIYINYYNNLYNNGLPGSNGYPLNLRKIAVANGSLQDTRGFDNPFEPNGVELSGTTENDQYPGNGFQTLKIKGYTNFMGHTATIESYFMPSPGEFHKVAYKKMKNPTWHHVDSYSYNINSRGSMDNTPGGWFPTQQELAKEIVSATPCEWFIGQFCVNNWNIENLQQVSSFIPTVSALGFFNPDFEWDQPLNRNLVCTGEIPFDTYYGPKKNEQHTSFTAESVAWILEELAGNPQPPTVYYTGDNLMGPQAICQNDLVTYEFDNCNPIPVQQWQVSSGLEIVTSDDFSVTVQNNTSSTVSGWIKAIFTNQIVQKDIWLGQPDAPAYLDGPEVVETASVVTYSGGVAPGATSYAWWLPYPFEVINPFDTSSPNWQVYPNAGRNTQVFTGTGEHSGFVQLMGVNSCGTGDAVMLAVEHGQGGSGQQQMPVYPFPNTSDDSFNLDFSSYPSGSYQIYIFDAFSNVLYEGTSENINKTISTLEMPAGNYFLHIHMGEEVLQYQLIIEH